MPTNRMSILCVQIINRRENMDVLLALNHIVIRRGFMGYRRKSSTFSHQTGVDGLFALYGDSKKLSSIGYFNNSPFINE